MDTNTPEGTGEWAGAPEDQIASRIQAVLDPQEDTQAEDVTDEPVEEPEEEAPEVEAESEELEETVEAEETEESPEDEPEVRTVKVKLDGDELELPIEEVAKGYQRQADYTRKTQALADKEKQLESTIAESQAQYAQVINQMSSFLDGQQAQKPDPALAQEDPYEYTRQLAQYNEHQERSQAVKAEQQRLAEERKAEEHKRLQAHVAREQEVLLEKVPEWRDGNVAKAEQGKMKTFLREFGVSEEELSDPYSVFQTDHRAILLTRLAMQAHDLKSQKPKADAKVKGKPKVSKPGAARSKDDDGYTKAKGRLRKSGSLADAASAIDHIL